LREDKPRIGLRSFSGFIISSLAGYWESAATFFPNSWENVVNIARAQMQGCNKIMIKITSLLLFLALALGIGVSVSSCNTVEGVGQDISAAARGVKRSVFK
jgi:predicted small secreted protein